ncbi:GGDEF domain-containing protein [Psychromonas hadalis]|uniref:GGDEF domain-containing protein n=1 Tax=Psychromonas hadalis TaxID=211669 RepID=UPI00146BAE75|nr:GGDEF domain-containing protein [Psychromonas hadalis]
MAFFFIKTDLFEQFYHFSREYESIQLDELFPLAFMLLMSVVYFLSRRLHECATYRSIVEQQASQDPLTKLFNRRTLERKLEAEWDRFLRYHEDFCVMIFDIDDFKVINDTLGYVRGDRVLIEIAEMLINNTRKTDFCARWGEEEFLILCPVCKDGQALILAEKLRSTLYRTLQDGVELSASFAVVQSDNSTSLEELMKRVHFGLHKAKKRGKNCVVSG